MQLNYWIVEDYSNKSYYLPISVSIPIPEFFKFSVSGWGLGLFHITLHEFSIKLMPDLLRNIMIQFIIKSPTLQGTWKYYKEHQNWILLWLLRLLLWYIKHENPSIFSACSRQYALASLVRSRIPWPSCAKFLSPCTFDFFLGIRVPHRLASAVNLSKTDIVSHCTSTIQSIFPWEILNKGFIIYSLFPTAMSAKQYL